MFGAILVHTAKVAFVIHFNHSVDDVIMRSGRAHHTTNNELGALHQRIVIDLVNGKLENILFVLSIENGKRLVVVMTQQVIDFALSTETATQYATHIGVLVLDTVDSLIDQLKMFFLC